MVHSRFSRISGSSQHAIFIFLDFFRPGGHFPALTGLGRAPGVRAPPESTRPGALARGRSGVWRRVLGARAAGFPEPALPFFLALFPPCPCPGGPGSCPGGAEAGGGPPRPRPTALAGADGATVAFGPSSSLNPNPPMPPPAEPWPATGPTQDSVCLRCWNSASILPPAQPRGCSRTAIRRARAAPPTQAPPDVNPRPTPPCVPASAGVGEQHAGPACRWWPRTHPNPKENGRANTAGLIVGPRLAAPLPCSPPPFASPSSSSLPWRPWRRRSSSSG